MSRCAWALWGVALVVGAWTDFELIAWVIAVVVLVDYLTRDVRIEVSGQAIRTAAGEAGEIPERPPPDYLRHRDDHRHPIFAQRAGITQHQADAIRGMYGLPPAYLGNR